jgi:hypothetical protein
VTENLTVAPIFIFDTTTETPTVNAGSASDGYVSVELESSTDDAVIFFTLDGSEPTETSHKYDDLLWLDEESLAALGASAQTNGNLVVKAKAYSADKNNSDTAIFEIELPDDDVVPHVEVLTDDASRFLIGDDEVKIPMGIFNPGQYTLGPCGYALYLKGNEDDPVRSLVRNDLVNRTDKAVGLLFTISELIPGTEYTIRVYVESDYGLLISDGVTFTTTGENAFLLGDVDGNGNIDTKDARLALRIAIQLEPDYTPDTRGYKAGDINLDGTVATGDARLILRRAIGFTDADQWGVKK